MRFQQKLSGHARLSPLSSCPCEAPLSRSEVTDVAQLQLSIFWRQFSPAFQSCWHTKIRIQNRSLPRLRLIARGTFPRRSSNVRGRLRPTLE